MRKSHVCFSGEASKRKTQKHGGKAGLICKNEYRVIVEGLEKPFAYIDHVWLQRVPILLKIVTETLPYPLMEDIPVVAFEITKDLTKLWDTKKMKGDVTNLRFSGAAIGVLIIPKKRLQQNPPKGAETWIKGLDNYLERLKKLACPMRVEIWDLDDVLSLSM